MKRASMKDVAKQAGVSIATVSNIINNTSKVKDETRDRVYKAIKDLSYQVDLNARRLRTRQSNVVGFLVSEIFNYFYQEVGFSIEKELSKYGYHLFYINSNEDPVIEKQNLQLCLDENFAGIIITPVSNDYRDYEYIFNYIPVVFMDRNPQNIRKDTVLGSNRKDSFFLTSEMIKRGAKKLAFVAPQDNHAMRLRLHGFLDVLEQNNIEVDKSCIRLEQQKPTLFGDLDSFEEWYIYFDFLLDKKHVDCLVLGNNVLSYAFYNYCMNRGLVLQKDIFFASFDVAPWMRQVNQEIVAINQSTEEIGQKTASLLLRRMKQEVFPYETYLIDGTFEVLNSPNSSNT